MYAVSILPDVLSPATSIVTLIVNEKLSRSGRNQQDVMTWQSSSVRTGQVASSASSMSRRQKGAAGVRSSIQTMISAWSP